MILCSNSDNATKKKILHQEKCQGFVSVASTCGNEQNLKDVQKQIKNSQI